MASKRYVVDRLMFDERSAEELEILSSEMANYLTYYTTNILPSLEHQKIQYVQLLTELTGLGKSRNSSLTVKLLLCRGAPNVKR